ncbi:MAG: hypothetical protein ABSH48_02375 [Verrucomicrobiota bacterium]|jgi:hypothetical protein
MSDRDKTLKLLNEMGVIGQPRGAGAASKKEGEQVSPRGPKHLKMRRLMDELNRISPGLGESLRQISDADLAAGESAEGGAAGLKGFAVAMDSALLTLGPLLSALLSAPAVMDHWDIYKEKVKEAAAANAEAMKQIEDSTRGAVKAVNELNEAMHAKEHHQARPDELALKPQDQQSENAYTRQRELNKADENKALPGAGFKEGKKAIKQPFELLDQQLPDRRDKPKAALEDAMAESMQYHADDAHIEDGQAFTQAQAAQIAALKQLLDLAHQNSTAMLSLIVDGVKKHETLKQIIADVQAQMGNGGMNFTQ